MVTMEKLGTWQMYAYRYGDGRFHSIGSEEYVIGHGLKQPIFRVKVEEVPEGDDTATHWGWMRSAYSHYVADTSPRMIWYSRGMLEVCFTYGVQAEIDRGHGRVVTLRITEAQETKEPG
jgi:hypothetical protein